MLRVRPGGVVAVRVRDFRAVVVVERMVVREFTV